MKHNRWRLVVATSTALLATSVVAGTAQATSAPTAPEGHLTTSGWSGADSVRESASGPSSNLRAKAAAGEIVETFKLCPTGTVPSRTLSTAGFEDGKIPYPEYSNGWTVTTGNAGTGTRKAQTTIAAGADDVNLINTNYIDPANGRMFLSFQYKGNYPDVETDLAGGLIVSNSSVGLYPTEDWTRVYADISSVVAADNFVDVVFGLAGDAAATSMQVDDVRVYTCGAPPNARVRGDWTGEGLVDVLGTNADGDMYLYAGKGNGAVASGRLVGSGWAGSTWLGSPGDVTGDGRTDLIQRRDNGQLYLYAGLGDGGFASGKMIGSGWNGFTSLATPGDMNLDGKPDLLARKADGTLHVYNFTGNAGALRYFKQVGSGWQGMKFIVGIGDLNKDRRGDVVGVNAADNCFYAYTTTTASGLASGKKVGCGWNTMNVITSPGDLDRDGLGDVLARNDAGQLYFYPGKPGGGVRSGKQVGSGWNSIATIL